MPRMSGKIAARPTCASALVWTTGSCTLPPDTTSPVTPAATTSGPAALVTIIPRLQHLTSRDCEGAYGFSWLASRVDADGLRKYPIGPLSNFEARHNHPRLQHLTSRDCEGACGFSWCEPGWLDRKSTR